MADNAHDQWVTAVLKVDPATYGDAAPGFSTRGDRHENVHEDAHVHHPAPAEAAPAGPDIAGLVKARKWKDAAEQMGFLDDAELRAAVAKLKPDAVRKIHAAAIKAQGQNSPVALATTSMDHAAVGPAQSARAAALAKNMSPEDQAELQKLMDGSKPVKELDYLEKGLAAGHTVAELKAFDKKIAGKDEKWMQDKLSLTGNSSGKGVKQQWSMSCNATTVEAVRGEMDPLYALKMHEDNPNLTEADDTNARAMNPKLAEDQRKMLESVAPGETLGGQARNRNDRTKGIRGRWNTDLLNDNTGETGLSFARQRMDTQAEKDKGVKDINEAVGKHMPVPIVIGDGGEALNAHYVLITASEPGPPRYYSIHDPGSGNTYIRSEDQLKTGNLDISGWNKIAAFEKPTPTKVQVKAK